MNEPEEIKPVIFIVEDNELYSLSLDFGLSHSGNYIVHTYKSGEECIKNLHKNPDVIVLDYYLPGKNGHDILKEVKQAHPDMPVIIMSSQNDIQVAVDLLKDGAYDYIIKNKYATLKLNAIIEQILSHRKVSEENVVLKIKVNKFKITVGILLLVILGFIIFLIGQS